MTVNAGVFALGVPIEGDNVAEVLNELLLHVRDAERGFGDGAEQAETRELQAMLSARSAECALAAAELAQVAEQYGADPVRGGTASGSLHRGWMHLKSSLGASTGNSILEDCERGAEAALSSYRNALDRKLPPEVHSLVERHANVAQDAYRHLRELRKAADADR